MTHTPAVKFQPFVNQLRDLGRTRSSLAEQREALDEQLDRLRAEETSHYFDRVHLLRRLATHLEVPSSLIAEATNYETGHVHNVLSGSTKSYTAADRIERFLLHLARLVDEQPKASLPTLHQQALQQHGRAA